MRLTLTTLATLSLGVILPAADFSGTWKLNLEKSQLGQNDPRASETMTISQTGSNAYTTAFDIVTKAGEKQHQEFNRIYDGKEHPLAGVNVKPEGFTEVCEQINPSTRKMTRKRAGKVVEVLTSKVSPDGKTMINTFGNGVVYVFDRQ